MATPIEELTLAVFLDGYALGYISDIVTTKIGTEWRVYGKDSRIEIITGYRFKIVWARMP